MERLEHDLLFRWLAGLGIDDAAWGKTANRQWNIKCRIKSPA
jgi:hypothetical protein